MSNPAAFNVALFELLSRNHYPAAMSFSQRGDSVIIHSFKEMESTVLPEVFGHSNYSSFVRQMNVYGFHKSRGGSSVEFVHPYFKRGRGDLVMFVQRQKRSCPGDHAASLSRDPSLMPTQTEMPCASALDLSSGSYCYDHSNAQLSTEPNCVESGEVAQLRARLATAEEAISKYDDHVKLLYSQVSISLPS